MLLSATLSKPTNEAQEYFGRPVLKIKLTAKASAQGYSYFMEQFTQKQVFHHHLSEQEALDFLEKHAGKTFKNCVKRTETQEITILANKKGKITTLTKDTNLTFLPPERNSLNISRKKNYLIPEGKPVPFLVLLGVMTDEGRIIASKQDKFRQINRFLEFIDDVIKQFWNDNTDDEKSASAKPLRIADFGCGKSYLTFAVHYFLTEIKKIPCEIEGLDLKEDVIAYCNEITQKLHLQGLHFTTGDISKYSDSEEPDIVITLHACDTATDFALKYAVSKNTKAILSVPCCQHEVNNQLRDAFGAQKQALPQEFEPLLKWGIIREKFASLVTDSLRGEWLEQQGYKVQMLEFIDEEHTPKNILIRAIKKDTGSTPIPNTEKQVLSAMLKITPEILR